MSYLTRSISGYYNTSKMLSDKIFINALIISVVFHMFLVIGLPQWKGFARKKSEEPIIKLTYYADRKVPIDSRLIARTQTGKYPLPQTQAKKKFSAQIEKQGLAKPISRQDVHEKIKIRTAKADAKALDRHISIDNAMLISHDEKDLSSEPVYLTYYNAVRSSIYKRANANKPYYSMEGVVKLVFTLARNGQLLNAGIAQDVSTRNPVLQKHALASIKRAAPFPAFHKSMNEQQLTLRLTISFEK